ncbi:unnamed protein product [Notodromas monacha]|uniref:Uncharacterized protein n=1 Tax=Notodromas monacha TaxID=399045 RepID=A0A7R9BLU5_9CRUS|nr:unnamed protein product [Notodromas monacha]CAG0917877.1 unnamed protein product [Notodromas monacha]
MDGPKNAFKNDGSFLEMFKQLQKSQPSPTDDKKPDTSSNSKAAVDPSTPVPVVAKRRGVRALPVGVVKKSKKEEESSEQKLDLFPVMEYPTEPTFSLSPFEDVEMNLDLYIDYNQFMDFDSYCNWIAGAGEEKGTAWMQYMKEVRKYKERNCDEETKVRPLVK